MKDRLTAKLKMYRAVEKHIDEAPTTAAKVKAFQTSFGTFKGVLNEIAQTAAELDTVLTGLTSGKNAAKETLARDAVNLADSLFAYASATNDDALKAEMKLSFTKLIRLSDNSLVSRVTNLHARAAALPAAAIADYGVTAAQIAALSAANTAFAAQAPTGRDAVSHRKTQNAKLETLFKKADKILSEQMDKSIAALKKTDADFVQTYENVRNIIDPVTKTDKPTNGAPN